MSKHIIPQGKYWIDLKGTIHLVCFTNDKLQLSHEEWANNKKKSLEGLLKKGWIRVQDVVPKYLYIDCLKNINKPQRESIEILMSKEYRTVMIEIKNKPYIFNDVGEAKKFLKSLL